MAILYNVLGVFQTTLTNNSEEAFSCMIFWQIVFDSWNEHCQPRWHNYIQTIYVQLYTHTVIGIRNILVDNTTLIPYNFFRYPYYCFTLFFLFLYLFPFSSSVQSSLALPFLSSDLIYPTFFLLYFSSILKPLKNSHITFLVSAVTLSHMLLSEDLKLGDLYKREYFTVSFLDLYYSTQPLKKGIEKDT